MKRVVDIYIKRMFVFIALQFSVGPLWTTFDPQILSQQYRSINFNKNSTDIAIHFSDTKKMMISANQLWRTISLNLFLFVIGGGAGYPSGIEFKNASICDGQLFHFIFIEIVSVNSEHFPVIKTGQERVVGGTHSESTKCNKVSKSGVGSKSITVTCA